MRTARVGAVAAQPHRAGSARGHGLPLAAATSEPGASGIPGARRRVAAPQNPGVLVDRGAALRRAVVPGVTDRCLHQPVAVHLGRPPGRDARVADRRAQAVHRAGGTRQRLASAGRARGWPGAGEPAGLLAHPGVPGQPSQHRRPGRLGGQPRLWRARYRGHAGDHGPAARIRVIPLWTVWRSGVPRRRVGPVPPPAQPREPLRGPGDPDPDPARHDGRAGLTRLLRHPPGQGGHLLANGQVGGDLPGGCRHQSCQWRPDR